MQTTTRNSISADVVIVGAGPAGLMAAIAAGRAGATVVLLDHMPRAGTKLLTTGGGRCNLTNTLPPDAFMARFGRYGRFLSPALGRLSQHGVRQFFHSLGVATHATDGLHVFPVAESARAILDALTQEAGRCGVRSLTDCDAQHLMVTADGQLEGVQTSRGRIQARRVLLATGGCSYPKTGSAGQGHTLAREVGHSITPLAPALAPLSTAERWVGHCSGIALTNVTAWIDLPKCRQLTSNGEFLFTHTGISGPAVLNLSGDVALRLQHEPAVPLRLQLLPGHDRAEWERRIAGWRQEHGKKLLRSLLDQHLPASLAAAWAGEIAVAGSGTPDDLRLCHLTRPQQDKLLEYLTATPVTITATGGFDKAMATRGGVSLKEVRPETMESRLLPGIFFAGEVLDVDGPCGGFNLQWAFSSGWLAGQEVVGTTTHE